jgi:hypothetical protein
VVGATLGAVVLVAVSGPVLGARGSGNELLAVRSDYVLSGTIIAGGDRKQRQNHENGQSGKKGRSDH